VFRKLTFLTGILTIALITALLPAAAWQFQQPRSPSEQEKEMQDRQIKEANKKRQEDIKNDTEKLFQLATELKAAVDKTNENMLSLDVIRKADEVEKLAKRVKEKMKQSIGPSPRLEPGPMGPVPRPPG
jgi:nitric oxide reductase activation protein